MKSYVLSSGFYLQNTLTIAQKLLGTFLVRIDEENQYERFSGKIVETEAYVGPSDLASHAHAGKTPRTQTMFEAGGIAYIYFIYGMYYCLNIVTGKKEYPAAVLIRAVEPVEGIEAMWGNRYGKSYPKGISKTDKRFANLTNGPGKVCQAFEIDKTLNGASLTGKTLFVEDRGEKPGKIVSAPRIGVDYARQYKDKPWRFYVQDNLFVSKK